jgi:hypothetical protein
MKGKAIIYRPGAAMPEETFLAVRPPLGFLNKAVGGYIEAVPGFNSICQDGRAVPCVAFCNEEGKLQGLPFNNSATALWDRALRRIVGDDGGLMYPNGLSGDEGRPADVLVGPVIVLIGDDEFMAWL